MSKLLLLAMLLVSSPMDWAQTSTKASSPNQRIGELQNRHDRRFQAPWSPRSTPRSRFR